MRRGGSGLLLTIVIGCALAAACADAPPRPAAAGAPVEIALPAALSPATPAEPSQMPTPARARRDAAVVANQACEGCHEEVAREWRASLHRTANTEPAYRRAFAIEPMPFCRSCHAPEANPAEPEAEAVGALGVGCVTCHVTTKDSLAGPGAAPVLAAPWTRPGSPPAAPHAVIRDERFARADACAGCHEFAFPTARGLSAAEMMQLTIAEHRASPAADRSCADCHMPAGGDGQRRRRSHEFPGSRDEALVRSAVAVEARRVSATRIAVTLSPSNAGHAFPTGDLFRRLSISAEALGADEMVLGQEERFLTRHWVLRPGQVGRRLLSDDRVHAAPVTVELEVGAAGEGRPIAWQVTYQRVAHPNGIDMSDVELEGEIRVASGKLGP